MKNFFSLFLFSLSLSGIAGTIEIEPVDQKKLAHLLSRIPKEAVICEETAIEKPVSGKKVNREFVSGPLRIECTSLYYQKSPHATSATCKLSLNEKASGVLLQNDEIVFTMNNRDHAKALFQAIPYGKPEKMIWSWERDYGRNIDGQKAPIFHYRIQCTPTKCVLTFSSQRLSGLAGSI